MEKLQEMYMTCVAGALTLTSVKRDRFCQKKLFASDATKEEYAVWIIANSNWTRTKGGKWQNVISGDFETINEYWDKNALDEFELDEIDRVVFAKSKDNVYIFLGEYKCAEIKHQDNVKIYKRISKTYK